MDNPDPSNARYQDEEAQRILLYALDLQDRTFTRQQLEEMAQELGISPDLLQDAEQALRAQNPNTTPTILDLSTTERSAPTILFEDQRGLLVTTDALLVHGRRFPLATVLRAEKQPVRLSSTTLTLLILSGLLLIFIPLIYAIYHLSQPKRVNVILHLPAGPQIAYTTEDESLAEALVAAINRAIQYPRSVSPQSF